MTKQKNKVIILQRVIPSYRVAVFKSVTTNNEFDTSLIIGGDVKGAKAKNAIDLSGVRYHRLTASAINLMGRTLIHHHGLMNKLKVEQPDVIICEAESHFLGYITAILYKLLFSRKTKLILWCFYALPGIKNERSIVHSLIKRFSRKFFTGFISYSTFGKRFLISKGYKEGKITVAVNVCDTAYYLNLDQDLKFNKSDAKDKLGIGGKFVITYVGTLDPVKRPDVLVELGNKLDCDFYQIFIIGSGPMENELVALAAAKKLCNVTFTGRLDADLPIYYRASDLIIIPGRGGIVISEAMCFGVPVLVHQADGVEYDLVIPERTGKILASGDVNEFLTQIKLLSDCPPLLDQMGLNAKKNIIHKHNTESMSSSIIQSIRIAINEHEY